MTPGVLLQPMRWWQVQACADIDASVFPDSAWSVGSFWGELARVPETRHYIVAVESESRAGADPEVLGYAGIAALPPEADVQTIAVAPSAQRLGLGTDLLRALLDEAGRRACTTVMLEVAADNQPAIALYERHGFERISTRRDYYAPGRDAIIMRRRGGSDG